MKHPISEHERFDYLDGALSDSKRASMDEHLLSCTDCRNSAELMRAVDEALIEAGASLRRTLLVRASDTRIAKQKVFAKLGDSSIPIRLGSLYLLMAPMCGEETSTRAIRAAARNVYAVSPRQLEDRLWPGFVEHLHAIVATLCGEPAAQLILKRGMSLQQEAA
jgi:hypothetical protein